MNMDTPKMVDERFNRDSNKAEKVKYNIYYP